MNAIFGCFFVMLAAAQLAVAASQGTGIAMDAGQVEVSPDVFECDRTAALLRECYNYLRCFDTKPSLSCCNGAKVIIEMASNPEDQPLGCKCYKEATSHFNNIKENAMSELCKECLLNLARLHVYNCKQVLSFETPEATIKSWLCWTNVATSACLR